MSASGTVILNILPINSSIGENPDASDQYVIIVVRTSSHDFYLFFFFEFVPLYLLFAEELK